MQRIDAAARDAAERAAQTIKEGGIVLIPTDTLYGFAADALSDAAVDKIYAIKGRDESKPIHALVADIAMAEQYADVSDDVRVLIERLPLGKVTVICKKKTGLESGVCRYIDTFGFRIPDNAFCIAMMRAFGKPVTATSANVAGEVPQRTVQAILEQFERSHIPPHERTIDLIIDGGELPDSRPSTVVDFSGEHPIILREGAIAAVDVWNALRIQDADRG